MPTEQNIVSKREQAKQSYIEGLPKSIVKLQDTWQHLRHVCWDPKGLTFVYQLAHKLYGGALTLELAEIITQLKIINHILGEFSDNSDIPNQEDSDAVEQALDKLVRLSGDLVAQSGSVEFSSSHSPTETKISQLATTEKLIYLVDDDQVIRDVLGEKLREAGLQVKTFEKVQDLYVQLKTENPSLVLLDIYFPTEGALAGIDVLQSLRLKTGFHVPVLFISARTDQAVRLRCLRAGGSGFFAKPIELEPLLQKIDELTASEQEKYRALLIDDDQLSLDLHAEILASANFLVQKETDPLKALRDINTHNPDILLLDLMMPKCNGVELAKMLRQDPNLSQLPIVFITGVDTKKAKQVTQEIDHSFYLTKPIRGKMLIDEALKLARQYRFMAKKRVEIQNSIGLESLLTRQVFYKKLQENIGNSTLDLKNNHLLYVAYDQLAHLRSHFGLAKLDEINKPIFDNALPALQKTEYISALSDGICLILLSRNFENSLTFAESLFNQLLHMKFEDASPPVDGCCSIGMVSLQNCNGNFVDAVGYAEVAANQALTNGGKTIVSVVEKEIPGIDPKNQLVLHGELEEAVKSKSYLLNFQSIINLADPAFVAYEVLVKLQNSMGHELSPAQFFDTVMELDASIEMDRWIYNTALEAISKDQRNMEDAFIFLKVSHQTLNYKLLPSILNGLIKEHRLRGDNRLIFQLNHNDFLKDVNQGLFFASALRDIQCDVALENFTLQGKLDAIQKLRPSFIKLSPQTLQQALESPEKAELLKLFVASCAKLQIKVIGASIEDNETMQQCFKMGVKYFQGYLIQRPSSTMR